MSGEKDYSPLSLACVKSLTDKNYDKRRQAALEIEKYGKTFIPSFIVILIRPIN